MGIYLLHVRFRVAVEHAIDQFFKLAEDIGWDAQALSQGGDTFHCLVKWPWGAAHLANRLRASLAQSLVDDWNIVEVQDFDAEESVLVSDDAEALGAEDGADIDEDDRSEGDEDPEIDYDDEEEDAESDLLWWWRTNGPPKDRRPRFRRRSVLLITTENREDSPHVEQSVRKVLPDSSGLCHGRRSILLAFWEWGEGVQLAAGELGRALDRPEVSSVYLMDLGSDFASMNGDASPLAVWYRRDPSMMRQRPRGTTRVPVGRPCAPRPPRRPFIVETVKRRT